MNGTGHPQPRQELDYRRSGGIEVTLLWSATDNQLTVQVIDHLGGESFELAVDHPRANHAFHHPWAYAAEQGVQPQAVAPSAA